MKLKKGAVLAGLDLRMRVVLKQADLIWQQMGEELVVTSGLDGGHSAGSWHYYGLGVDLRTRYFTAEQTTLVASLLTVGLGDDYRVVIEATHIHVSHPV